MLEAAKALHDPANGVTGWVGRGLKNANVPVWTNLLLGWDVDSIDAQGEMHTTEEPAVAAAQLYKTLNVDYGPAGLERLQLDGVPGELHAGPRRHVARRHRLRRAGRGQDQVARRRPGAVRHAAQGPEGAAFGLVRRRHGRVGLLREEGGGLPLLPVGDQQAHGGPPAPGRLRRAGPQRRLHRPGGAGRHARRPRP